MNAQKDQFSFDGFLNKLENALLAAQRTAVMAERAQDDALVSAANRSIKSLREARAIIDNPLVWFKLEKGAIYRKDDNGKWKIQNPGKPGRPVM